MSMKDWKCLERGKDFVYENKKNGNILTWGWYSTRYKIPYTTRTFYVELQNELYGKVLWNREFPNRIKAVSFAKEYMRKH